MTRPSVPNGIMAMKRCESITITDAMSAQGEMADPTARPAYEYFANLVFA